CGDCKKSCFIQCIESSCNEAVDVTLGPTHGCVLLEDGSAWCWGKNEHGQLGDGTTSDRSAPVKAHLPSPAAQISAAGPSHYETGSSESYTCATMTNGSLTCWGSSHHGQLGNNQVAGDVRVPTKVDSLAGVSQVAASNAHTCVVKTDGSVSCWGRDGNDIG